MSLARSLRSAARRARGLAELARRSPPESWERRLALEVHGRRRPRAPRSRRSTSSSPRSSTRLDAGDRWPRGGAPARAARPRCSWLTLSFLAQRRAPRSSRSSWARGRRRVASVAAGGPPRRAPRDGSARRSTRSSTSPWGTRRSRHSGAIRRSAPGPCGRLPERLALSPGAQVTRVALLDRLDDVRVPSRTLVPCPLRVHVRSRIRLRRSLRPGARLRLPRAIAIGRPLRPPSLRRPFGMTQQHPHRPRRAPGSGQMTAVMRAMPHR